MMVTNGSFNARLIGASGSAVVLETSDNLHTWTPIQTNSLTAAELNFSAPALTNQNQYFRAALSP